MSYYSCACLHCLKFELHPVEWLELNHFGGRLTRYHDTWSMTPHAVFCSFACLSEYIAKRKEEQSPNTFYGRPGK